MRRILLLALFARAAAAGEPLDRLLAPDTTLVVGVEEAARLRKSLDGHPFVAAFREAAFREQMNPFQEPLEKALADAKRRGLDVLAAVELVEGQAWAGLEVGLPPGGMEFKLGLVFLAEVGENGEKVREHMRRLEEANETIRAARRTEEEVRGVTVVTYHTADEGEEDGEDGEEEEAGGGERFALSWFLAGDLFGLASRPDLLHDVVRRRGESDAKSLATLESYAAVRARLAGRSDLFVFGQFGILGAAVQAADGVSGGMASAFFRASGLDRLSAIGMTLGVRRNGLDGSLYLHTPGEKIGLLKLLDGPNADLAPPAFVPPDAINCTIWSVDLASLFDEVRRSFDRFQPGFSAMFDGWMDQVRQATGVDVRNDVVAALGSRLTLYTLPPEPGGETPGVVVALDVTDRRKLDEALTKFLAAAPPNAFEDRDYLGTPIRVVKGAEVLTPAFAVLPSMAVFATRVGDLQALLASQGKEVAALSASGAYARAIAGLPKSCSAVSFSDDAKSMVAGNPLQKAIEEFLEEAMGLSAGANETRPPDLSALAKHFDVSASAIVNEEEGVSYRWVVRMRATTVEGAGDGD